MLIWTEFQQRFSASRRLSPETVRGYFADLELFLAYWAGREPLAGPHDVQKKHLADWFLAMKKRTGVSEATAGARMRSVLVLLRWAVRQQILLIDPSHGLKVQKPSRPIPRILTQSEVSHLLQAPLQKNRFFTKLRDRAILELLYATGMRGGELLALNVQDLELADASLQILTGKGKNRRLPLTEPAVRALREYLDWILPRYAQSGESALFLTIAGERLTTTNLHSLIARYGKLLGIAGVTAHAFRRALATHLLQNGAELVQIQRLLGHEDINSTMVYTRVFPADLIKAHRRSHPRARRR